MRDLVKETVEQLHAELENSKNVNPDLEVALKQLSQDIERVLDQSSDKKPHPETLRERSEAVAARFTAAHPRLERILNELADALGKMGI